MPQGGRSNRRGTSRRHVGSRGWAVADPAASGYVVARSRTPLVGHIREMERLRQSAVAASRGHPHVVLLTGPTGIGKTRLLDEAAKLADERGLRVVRLRCDGGISEDFLSLWPLVNDASTAMT